MKVMFYIAQYSVRWTTQSALHFTLWQTCSFRHQLGLCANHCSHAAIMRGDYFTHISTAVYSQVLISTAEWTGASWREWKSPNVEKEAKWRFRPQSLSMASSAFYGWATAPHIRVTIKGVTLRDRERNDKIRGGLRVATSHWKRGKPGCADGWRK